MACVVGIFAVVGTVKTGLTWATYWWVWLIIGLTLLVLGVGSRKRRIAVGAEWLRCGKAWVRTYELTEIKAGRGYGKVTLTLTDADGRALYTNWVDLQENRALWDLVYNGILHSVHVNGAEINALARKTLEIEP